MKKLFTYLLVAAGVLGSTQLLKAQTTVPALIQSNQVWDISGSPYNINQNTYIDTGVTVKVMPGVEVIAANNSIVLEVDGEFQALGTVDSMIFFDKMQIKFEEDAVPYNSTTGSGAYFNYCEFSTAGVGKRSIWVNGTSAKIENCLFTDTYYGIYIYGLSQSTTTVEVLNNTFNDSTGTSFPIYASGTGANAMIKGNTFNNFDNGGGLVLYGGFMTFINNTVNGHNYMRVRSKVSAINCNEFYHMRSGVEVMLYDQDTLYGCEFTNNTMDSCGSSVLNDPMLKVWKLSSTNLNGSKFNNNNFLNLLGAGFKVEIYGGNPTPTTAETVDFTNNYWMSTDSATIEGYIEDFADDYNIFGRADFSGYLSAIDSSCGDTSSCIASYYIAIDTLRPFEVFLVEDGSGATANTDYIWFWGDGAKSDTRYPSHQYMTYGLYNVSMRMDDPAASCQSQFSIEVGVDSTGRVLKKSSSFTVNVVKESDITTVPNADLTQSLRIYPNPSHGKIFIELDELSGSEVTYEILDLRGKVVFREHERSATGKHLMDVSELPEGIYYLSVRVGQERYTSRISIR